VHLSSCLTAEPVRPFDFIIDGELLRKSLEQHLLEHNISPVRCSPEAMKHMCCLPPPQSPHPPRSPPAPCKVTWITDKAVQPQPGSQQWHQELGSCVQDYTSRLNT